jgi:hypothetical protein
MQSSTKMNPATRRPHGMTVWLVEDTYISGDPSEIASMMPADTAQKLRGWLAAGRKMTALVWLVVIGSRRMWCAFCGGDAEARMTPVGAKTLPASTSLPGLPATGLRIDFAFISGPERFEPVVTKVLSAVPDRSLVCFVGYMAGSLDDLVFQYMQPQGKVKAAVELTAGGWPFQWSPYKSTPRA